MKKLFENKSWKVVKLSELCEIKRGASPRPISNKDYFAKSGRGWVRISDVTNSYKYLQKTEQYLSKLGESLSVPVDRGDLIMSICATIGKPILLDMDACIHDGFVIFRNVSKDIDLEYLFYYLTKIEAKFKSMKQTGTQGNLNTSLVGSVLIPVPPIEEQKKIVQIMRDIDEKLQNHDNQKQKLELVKKGLMNDLLTGKKRVDLDG